MFQPKHFPDVILFSITRTQFFEKVNFITADMNNVHSSKKRSFSCNDLNCKSDELIKKSTSINECAFLLKCILLLTETC